MLSSLRAGCRSKPFAITSCSSSSSSSRRSVVVVQQQCAGRRRCFATLSSTDNSYWPPGFRAIAQHQHELNSARRKERRLARQAAAKARAASRLEAMREAREAERRASEKRAANVGMQAFMEFEMKLARQQAKPETEVEVSQVPFMLKPPKQPHEPDPQDCCGNDCPKCVWIEYWEQLQKYEADIAIYRKQHGVQGA